MWWQVNTHYPRFSLRRISDSGLTSCSALKSESPGDICLCAQARKASLSISGPGHWPRVALSVLKEGKEPGLGWGGQSSSCEPSSAPEWKNQSLSLPLFSLPCSHPVFPPCFLLQMCPKSCSGPGTIWELGIQQ